MERISLLGNWIFWGLAGYSEYKKTIRVIEGGSRWFLWEYNLLGALFTIGTYIYGMGLQACCILSAVV